jgi:LysR family transcriptional regulator, transcriptional activator of nhaA
MINYKHLQYFWTVAKEGSIVKAAARLGVTSQTISGQISLLEGQLGKSLLTPKGRGLVLTDAGRQALVYADQIFMLGERLQRDFAQREETPRLMLAVGATDSIPKLVMFRVLESAMALAVPVHLNCHEGELDDLLAELALHKLDMVLTDQAVPSGSTRLFSHLLGEAAMSVYGTQQLIDRYHEGFPASLNGAPMILPTLNTAIRARLDQWFEQHEIRPRVVGEFEDSSLLKTFGRSGLGLFPALTVLANDIADEYRAQCLGDLVDLRAQFYLISTERRIKHPAVEAIRNISAHTLFGQGQAGYEQK